MQPTSVACRIAIVACATVTVFCNTYTRPWAQGITSLVCSVQQKKGEMRNVSTSTVHDKFPRTLYSSLKILLCAWNPWGLGLGVYVYVHLGTLYSIKYYDY